MRITMNTLSKSVELMNGATENRYGFSLGAAYGGYRVESHDGSRDVSGYMSAASLDMWITAFLVGTSYAIKAGYEGSQP